MGIGEILIAAKEIYELIKIIMEILDLLDIDEKDAEEALKKLKECIEGPLAEAIGDVVNELIKACSNLIEDFKTLFNTMTKDVEEITNADSEGAKLLKEALHM